MVVLPLVSVTFSPLPEVKPLPAMVRVCTAAEPVMGFGLRELIAGAATTVPDPQLSASS